MTDQRREPRSAQPSATAERVQAAHRYDLWGSTLSPFALKLEAMLRWAGVPYRWLPREGRRMENLRAFLRVMRAKRSGRVIRYDGASELDEYPLVPYLLDPEGRVYYDSSALALWIDEVHPPSGGSLIPDDPVLSFLTRLIDEAFDEFGLYMVHHNRWVLAARDNGAGRRLAAEMAALLPPGLPALLAWRFPRRQVRRLPYLFSVADSDCDVGLSRSLTPPARPGFPPTHRLLGQAWHRYLAAMETALEHQPFLLGERFTLADASAYGQLGMNLSDPSAEKELAERAPRTHAWLLAIQAGEHCRSSGRLQAAEVLRPLLQVISETFVPLMCQNERAYVEHRRRGERLFNEAAFDRGRALYDGELMGMPFRSVAKTFQVRTWRDLRVRWQGLTDAERDRLAELLGDVGGALAEPVAPT